VREDGLSGVGLLGRAIDNSQIVREVDPRSSREIGWLLLLVAVLVGGLVLYAWPHFQIRQTGRTAEQLSRERDKLLEENRKLQLEKASLENLRRVEAIATRELGLAPPPPERSIVVEAPRPLPPGTQLASRGGTGGRAEEGGPGDSASPPATPR
jgi:cell division protein FtsL